MSGKVVRLNKTVHGRKQTSRILYHLFVSTLEDVGFEQCLVDPCVLRLIVGGEVIAVIVIHAEDIQIAPSQKLVEVVISVLSDAVPATCKKVFFMWCPGTCQ